MKKFYVFIIALMMILMSIPVSAHDEYIGEISTEPIDSGVSVMALSCGHNDSKLTTNSVYHIYTCNVCDEEDKRPHDTRHDCSDTTCDTCGYIYGSVVHSYQWVTTNYSEGSETHTMTCRNYYYPYGYCGYERATESCRSRASGAITYLAASGGYHKYYQTCSLCYINVYMGKVQCVGASCEYCP